LALCSLFTPRMSYAAAHRSRVMLLYRRALKSALDWTGDRQQWYARARAVRGEFEANRETVRSGVGGGSASARASAAAPVFEAGRKPHARTAAANLRPPLILPDSRATDPPKRPNKTKPEKTPPPPKKGQETRDAADRLLDKGEALLKEWRHPDPLVPPYWVGGTAFSRNPPMSESVKISLDFGREDGH